MGRLGVSIIEAECKVWLLTFNNEHVVFGAQVKDLKLAFHSSGASGRVTANGVGAERQLYLR